MLDISEYTIVDADLAARWNRKESTIRALRSKKKLPPCAKVLGTPKYRLADILEFELSFLKS